MRGSKDAAASDAAARGLEVELVERLAAGGLKRSDLELIGVDAAGKAREQAMAARARAQGLAACAISFSA